MSLISEIADLTRRMGETQARGQAERGQIWGQAIANIGQTIAGIPAQMQQAKAMEEQTKIRELQAQELQRKQQAEERAQKLNETVNGLMEHAMTTRPDGTMVFDRDKLRGAFVQAQVPIPAQQLAFKTLDDWDASQEKFAKTRNDHLADVAHGVLANIQTGGDPDEALSFGIAFAKANHLVTDEQMRPVLDAIAQGADVTTLLKQVRGMSEKYKGEGKGVVIPRGGTLANPMTGETIAEGQPPAEPNPTEASLALQAAEGDPAKALELMKTASERNPTEASIAMQAAKGDPVKALRLMQQMRPMVPVVIQTAEGPQLLNRGTATTTPIKTATGETVQPAPTADMRNKAEGRKLVSRSINAIEDLSKRIITRIGPAQRAEAIARGASAVFGKDPDFRVYQDARMALAGNLAVAQQGSRPSDADIQAIWLPLVPDAYRDTSESAKQKWDLIKTMSNTPPSEAGGGGAVQPTMRYNPTTGKVEPIK